MGTGDTGKLAALRDYYDNTDQSAGLDDAVLDTSTVDDPMVGITVRLPASVLNAARVVAEQRELKVTALLRQWIEQELAEQVDDQRVVTVSELRRLIAHAS